MKKLLTLSITLLLLCSILIGCTENPPAVTYDVDGAAAYLDALYREDLSITSVDYEVASQVIVSGVTYEVSWTVDSDKVTLGAPANGKVVVNVDEKSAEEVAYKLTATVKAGDGTTKTVVFNLKVPKYDVNSHAEYMAAQKDEVLTVEGVVVAINSKKLGNKYNHLFLADTTVTGGYYCYSVEQDPEELGVKVGMTVKVTGPMAPYSGMQEIKGGQVAIIDSTIKTVAPVDITEAFSSGADLGVYVGLPVVIKGVSITDQELDKDTSQYLNFKLNGKTSYLRTYITDFPTTLPLTVDAEGKVSSAHKAAIDADHAAHFGYKADVTGILVLYSGAPYLIPMTETPFTNYVEVVKTPADKVADEKEALELGNSFGSDTVVELLTAGKYYNDVTITWQTSNTTNAAIADGKLTIVVPDTEIKVTVTATIKCGDVTDTKVFEITLSKTPVTIPEALEIPDGDNVLVSGTVKSIDTEWSEQYGNISVTIVDAEGNTLYVFRLSTKVNVGDVITVTGKMGTYNGARQVAAGATATIDEYAPVEVTLKEAVALEDGVKVIVKGTVKEINTAWSDQYGNITVTIEDAEGNTLYIYRLATKVELGNVVTITGKMATYNGARQIAAGATAVIGDGETPAGPVEVTLAEAVALEDGTDVIVKGTVKTIDTEWSEQYGNISVTIEDAQGNTLYIYRLATNVKVGDVVTITGKMATYNDARQIAAGATAVVTPAA